MVGCERNHRMRHDAEPRFAELRILSSLVQPFIGGTGTHEQEGAAPEKDNTDSPIHRRIEFVHPGRQKDMPGHDQSGACERDQGNAYKAHQGREQPIDFVRFHRRTAGSPHGHSPLTGLNERYDLAVTRPRKSWRMIDGKPPLGGPCATSI